MSCEWWKEAVFYQVYPRSFQDANADGIGDIQGIIQRLDYLKWLGVDALWLSPVFQSPQKDFGYDISDYCEIDSCYGTMDDMHELINQADQRGLKIILDGVYNHTSDQHHWFQDSIEKKNGKDDWYIWRDKPNNWTAAFGGSAWTYHPTRGQYYLHSFAAEQPDLNWRNPEVVAAILETMTFWLKKGVSGFRLDVFNSYLKDADFRDNPKRVDWVGLLGGIFYGYIGQEHLYDRDQDEIFSVLAKMRKLADSYQAVLVGETLDEKFLYEKAIHYVGSKRLHLVFHFGLLHSKWKAIPQAVQRLMKLFSAELPTLVLGNHDFPRQSKRWGKETERRKLMALFSLCLKGVPFIYYGEELGLPEAKLPKHQLQDPTGKKYYPFFKGRDGARTPMQWDQTANGGFTTEGCQAWLPLQNNLEQYSVESQQKKDDSVLNFYQKLLLFRKNSKILQQGICEVQAIENEIIQVKRILDGKILLILLNFSSKLVPADFGEYQIIFSTQKKTSADQLQPFQGVILEGDNRER